MRRRQRQRSNAAVLTPSSSGHVGGKFSALVDLPGDKKPSSDLADKPTKEVLKPSWDTNHVVAWRDADLPTPIYVRVDRSGAFHTYPNLCGPLQTLDEVQSAVDTHARGRGSGRPKEPTHKERVIHRFLYWPDGTRKVYTTLELAKRKQEDVRRLVEALLDKRNDDEDRADELKDIVHWQSICEGFQEWYYHLNVTVKTKGVADETLIKAEEHRIRKCYNLDDEDFMEEFYRKRPNIRSGES